MLGIDYFLGDAVQFHTDEPGFNLPEWAATKVKPAQEAAAKWIKAVKEIYGGTYALSSAAVDLLISLWQTLRIRSTAPSVRSSLFPFISLTYMYGLGVL